MLPGFCIGHRTRPKPYVYKPFKNWDVKENGMLEWVGGEDKRGEKGNRTGGNRGVEKVESKHIRKSLAPKHAAVKRSGGLRGSRATRRARV